jgi:hypothetical protein
MSRSPNVSVSFEFFPPADEAMEKTLWESIRYLEPLSPKFVSVTYGAGGSTRERTHGIVKKMAEETSLKPAGHITCVAATKPEIDQVLKDYWESGVKRIVALRGDPTAGIGAKYDRAYLLRAIVAPDAEIAAGYENVLITLANGEVIAGMANKEGAETLTLKSPADGKLQTLKKADIKDRPKLPSAMQAMKT